MKRIKKESILIILFVVYLLQGMILFINNEKIGTIKNNNEENKILNEEIFDSDIGIIIREINNLGFDIESIEKGYVCMLNFKLLRNICKVLQISIFDFFTRPVSKEDILAMV